MSIQQSIEQKLHSLDPVHLEVVNESHQHNVPKDSESHFKVTVVSDAFTNKMLINRHRMVNQILEHELANSIHALALHTKTPDEWFEQGGHVPPSPLCHGGSAKE